MFVNLYIHIPTNGLAAHAAMQRLKTIGIMVCQTSKEIGPQRKVKGLKEVAIMQWLMLPQKWEVRSFTSSKDVRQSASGVKDKTPSQKSFLYMTASEVTDDFVRSDVLGECCQVFKSPAGVCLFTEI